MENSQREELIARGFRESNSCNPDSDYYERQRFDNIFEWVRLDGHEYRIIRSTRGKVTLWWKERSA